MRGNDFTIINIGDLRYTRDRKYRVGIHFGMYYAAFKGCRCSTTCFCSVEKLPGGIGGTGFRSFKAIQIALKQFYLSRRKNLNNARRKKS